MIESSISRMIENRVIKSSISKMIESISDDRVYYLDDRESLGIIASSIFLGWSRVLTYAIYHLDLRLQSSTSPPIYML